MLRQEEQGNSGKCTSVVENVEKRKRYFQKDVFQNNSVTGPRITWLWQPSEIGLQQLQ